MPISKNSPPIFQHYNGKWRPLWRGRLHGIAALVAIPAGTLLILAAQCAIARVATSIYVFSLFALYSTSASYHLFTRTPHVQKIMQKLDHSMIFILIAGTYTPLCLLTLPHSWGIPFLCFVWVAAIMGMVFKFGWGARRITGGLYIALGWAGVLFFLQQQGMLVKQRWCCSALVACCTPLGQFSFISNVRGWCHTFLVTTRSGMFLLFLRESPNSLALGSLSLRPISPVSGSPHIFALAVQIYVKLS